MRATQNVTFETKHDTAEENATVELLQGIVDEFELGRYTFTRRVRVNERATPHSHPVLTLSTRFMVRTRDGALADYLHEQLHWFVARRRRAAFRASRQWRSLFGKVPRRGGGGGRTRRSTRLHLIVNWLEFEALTDVVGYERANAVFEAKAEGTVYPWVYRQVLDHHREIGDVLRRLSLA